MNGDYIMNRILLILTGGTIGSQVSGNFVDVNKDNSSCALLEQYKNIYNTTFTVVRPLTILSENMTTSSWNTIVQCISDELESKNDYTGIVIAHGSDTLSFTSSYLSFVFQNCKLPIVLTASNKPLSDPSSNGNTNFKACIDFIHNTKYSGVFTIYQNNESEIIVYQGNMICEADGFTDQYRDFTGTPFGCIQNGTFLSFKNIESLQEHLPAYEGPANPHIENNVLLIRPYPGQDYTVYNLKTLKPKAVLHILYHGATAAVDTDNKNTSLLSFIDTCNEYNIPVYISSCKSNDDPAYVTNKQLLEHGARPLYSMNYESAYAWLLLQN